MTTLIDPKSFADMHRNESIEEIAQVRDELIKSIYHYEELRQDKENAIHEESDYPLGFSPSAQYAYDLSCLAEICSLMADKLYGTTIEELG